MSFFSLFKTFTNNNVQVNSLKETLMMITPNKILNRSICSNSEIKILLLKISSVNTWMNRKMVIFSLLLMFWEISLSKFIMRSIMESFIKSNVSSINNPKSWISIKTLCVKFTTILIKFVKSSKLSVDKKSTFHNIKNPLQVKFNWYLTSCWRHLLKIYADIQKKINLKIMMEN